jgi:hypothetical protein
LHALQLGPAGTQEGEGATVNGLCGSADERRGLTSRSGTVTERDLCRLVSRSPSTSAPSRFDQAGWNLTRALAVLLRLDLLVRDPAGATDDGGVELVGVSRVGQRPWEVGANRLILGWG